MNQGGGAAGDGGMQQPPGSQPPGGGAGWPQRSDQKPAGAAYNRSPTYDV